MTKIRVFQSLLVLRSKAPRGKVLHVLNFVLSPIPIDIFVVKFFELIFVDQIVRVRVSKIFPVLLLSLVGSQEVVASLFLRSLGIFFAVSTLGEIPALHLCLTQLSCIVSSGVSFSWHHLECTSVDFMYFFNFSPN